MSEVEPQITAPTLGEAVDHHVAMESAEESAGTSPSVAPHGEHQAGDAEDAAQSVDVISNADSEPGDNAGPATADGTLSSVGEQAEETAGIVRTTDAPVQPEADVNPDASKPTSAKAKPSMSVKPTTGKSNGGPPTPLVKKIINSGTFGTGAVGKAPSTKPAAIAKTGAPPALKKATNSSTAPPSKTPMASSRTPAVSAAPPNRRQSVVPAKPSAPPTSKLSASTSAKPTTSAGAKPASSAGATRPSVVSPTGSVASASSRPRASVSEGVKRAPVAPRQSLVAGTKPSLAASPRPPVSRSSTVATSAGKPTRATNSISSIREVKEDGKVLEELQAQLKETTDSLASKAENVVELESRVGELTNSLETALADLASKASLTEQLSQDKCLVEKELSEVKNTLAITQSGRDDGESSLVAVQHDFEAAKAAIVAQDELVESLRAQIQTLETQVRSSQDALEIIQNSQSSDAERAAIEHEALRKAQADLKAVAAETESLKNAHAAALEESQAKLKDFEIQAALVNDLNARAARLKEEKEENSGKLSELEIEILELKESQEAAEDERERALARVKALEEEVLKATVAIEQAHQEARAKEAEVAAQVEELEKKHVVALKATSEDQEKLSASLTTLRTELAASLTLNEQAKADALASAEEHARKLEEASLAHVGKQRELEEEIQRIAMELESQEAYYDSKVNAVRDEHSRLLQQAFERAKIEAGEEHAQELQTLRAGSTSSIEQIKAANQLALEELKAEHTNLLDSEVNRLEKSITNLKLDLKATQDDLAKAKAALESARAEVTALTEQRDEARLLASSVPDSSAQAEEVARLSKDLSNTKDDLAAVTEMFNLTKVSLEEMSNNQTKDLEDAAKARAEEVMKLRAAHDEEITFLTSQKTELSTRVSDLEGELATLKAAIASGHASPKSNGNGAPPPASPGVTKEELQRMYEAHNLKIYDLEAEHEKAIKALKEELDATQNKATELNAEVQRKAMEIQYLEQDQEESQEQITRLKEDLDSLTEQRSKEQAAAA